jgi:trehalose/maltose transport system substrate-binding protein
MKCRCFRFALKTLRPDRRNRHIWMFRSLLFCGLCAGFLFTGFEGCRESAREPVPVTITLLDPGWLAGGMVAWGEHEEQEFTRETGILVKRLPAPEAPIDQLALLRKLLQNPSDAPDVFAIDVIWPAITAQYSLSLNSYRADTAQDFPALVNNDTVNGQLVAMPYRADAGLLFYRSDLLRAYGYRAPPATWDELERMAAQIQKGERSKGKKDFWGFVWQGAASEGLTCNALEWQVSEGGGRIIEDDGTITVNNPSTIRAWERAARWVGTISPPSVIAYQEWDGLNIWRAGNAAFMRSWPMASFVSESEGSAVGGKTAAARLPGGQGGRTGTLGGASLSVFRNSRHPKEAVALLRFLCRRDVELARALATSQPPAMPELYEDLEVIKSRPHFAELKQLLLKGIATRPSTIGGAKYEQISEAYFTAVHSVLTRKKKSAAAASDLEKELVQITGLQTVTAHRQ